MMERSKYIRRGNTTSDTLSLHVLRDSVEKWLYGPARSCQIGLLIRAGLLLAHAFECLGPTLRIAGRNVEEYTKGCS